MNSGGRARHAPEVEIALEVKATGEPLRERHREQEANRIWTSGEDRSSWRTFRFRSARSSGASLRPAVVLSATPSV